jgi:hypothetical protein
MDTKVLNKKNEVFFSPMEFCFQDGVFKAKKIIIQELYALHLNYHKEIFQVLA